MQLEEKLLTGCDNECEVRFKSRSENESFARIAVIGFMSVLNPTLEEVFLNITGAKRRSN